MSDELSQAIKFWLKYIAILLTVAVCLFAFEVISGEVMRREYRASLKNQLDAWNAKQPVKSPEK